MRRSPFLLLIFLFPCLAQVFFLRTALASQEIRIGGKEYVRLSDWAASHNLNVRWLRREEAIELVGGATRIGLQIHSPEAQLNGVEVRLLFPLVNKDQVVWISRMDLKSSFEPVLFPPRMRRGGALKTICLDPGHGGKDPGFQVGANQEKKLTLLLSEELQTQLKRAGWKVSLTRS